MSWVKELIMPGEEIFSFKMFPHHVFHVILYQFDNLKFENTLYTKKSFDSIESRKMHRWEASTRSNDQNLQQNKMTGTFPKFGINWADWNGDPEAYLSLKS
jgi:hypothetical protein